MAQSLRMAMCASLRWSVDVRWAALAQPTAPEFNATKLREEILQRSVHDVGRFTFYVIFLIA